MKPITLWPDWSDDFRIPTVGDSVKVASAHVLTLPAGQPSPVEFRFAVQPKSDDGVLRERAQAIATLLKRVHRDTGRFLQAHIDAEANRTSVEELKVDLKNILENYRSTLEYVAHYLAAACSPQPDEERVQFPIASSTDDATSFRVKLDRWFPGLYSSAPQAHACIMSVQPFASDPWLRELGDLSNRNKHRILLPHALKEVQSLVVTTGVTGVRLGELGLKSISVYPNAVMRFGIPGESHARIAGPALLTPYIQRLPGADPRIRLVREQRRLYCTDTIDCSIATKVWELSRGVVRAVDSVCNALSSAGVSAPVV